MDPHSLKNYPSALVVYDTEYTAWKGSQEREWGNADEHREIVQIGAVKVLPRDGFVEVGSFSQLVKPRKNNKLSQYFKELTGIEQEDVDRQGIDILAALQLFFDFVGHDLALSNGGDHTVFEENVSLVGAEMPLCHGALADVRPILERITGLNCRELNTVSLPAVFNFEIEALKFHQALDDSRIICRAIRSVAPTIPWADMTQGNL